VLGTFGPSMKRSHALRIAAAVTSVLAGLVLLAPAAGADTTISVDDNFYKPKKVKVTVPEKVTWEWDGLVAHNVVVEKGPQKFKTKLKTEGTFTRTIKKPGTYRIHCTIHPGMDMKITAVAAPPETQASATTAPPST
jgi:plastocyanin